MAISLETFDQGSLSYVVAGESRDYQITQKGLPLCLLKQNDRGQVDLIDMQAQEYNGYKWIFHCQDHLTKFSHLWALKTKQSKLTTIHFYFYFP